MVSLAPKKRSIGARSGMTSAIIASEKTSSMAKHVRKMRCASSCFPSPIRMPISGEPPHEIQTAADPTIVTTGPQTPTPARAISPTPAICPMYILSTMLYSTLTNCASMLGSAIFSTSELVLSRPRSFSFFMVYPSRYKFPNFNYSFFKNKHQPGKIVFPILPYFLNCFSSFV